MTTSTPRQRHGLSHEDQPPHRLIRASAGSGKTFSLTTRYLELLAQGHPPQAILATTFTRKAAGEILARVLGRLALAADDAGARAQLCKHLELRGFTEAQCRHLLRQLAQSLHRVAICTIDSFFNRIASSFRLELDIPVEPLIIDEKSPVARDLRLQAIQAMLADQDLDVLLNLLRRLHHDTATRSVTAALDSIVTELYDVYRQAPDGAVWSRLTTPTGHLNEADLVEPLAALREMSAHLPTTGSGQPNKTWLKAWQANCEHAHQRDWQGFLEKGIASKIHAGEVSYSKQPIADEWFSVYEPLIQHARADLVHQLVHRIRATHMLLERFDLHYTQLRREHGVLLFSDLTHKLAHMLPNLGEELLFDVYFRLDGQIHHLLLDEFQDTSLDQWRVLEPFVEEVIAHADRSRSFFCVGDVKQALYGWRGGCAELFDNVEASLSELPNACQSLSESWRSSQVVLDAVNEVFTGLTACPALADDYEAAQAWQDRFEPHSAAKDLPGHVQLLTSPAADADEPDDADDDSDLPSADEEVAPASVHERYVAELVHDFHAKHPGRSVGVLVGTNKAVNRLLFELRTRGVHASGEGGSPLTDSPAVAAVLAAITLADHPGHSAAAFHVANSPLGEVLGIRGIDPGPVHAMALRLRAELLERGYAAVISRWTRQLAPHCDARDLARLTQLVQLAQQYSPMLSLRPSQFVDFVAATPVEEPSPATVRVMTIHAAKGLEFDLVVLPELNRKLTDRWPIFVEREHPTGPITGVYPGARKEIRESIPELQQAYLAQRAREREEDLCNLYVAMTRPRHALWMIVKPLAPKKDGQPRSTGLCFASVLRSRLAHDHETYAGGETLYSQSDANWAGDGDTAAPAAPPASKAFRVKLAPAKNERLRRAWLPISPSGLESAGRVRAADLLDLASHAARQRGSLIHAWFQTLGFIDEAMPSGDELDAAALEAAPNADADWLADQRRQWHGMLEHPDLRAALCRHGAADLLREHRFAVRDEGRLMTGAFDRVAITRDAAGRATAATLLDFKTDRYSDEAVARYQPQMQAYRRALARMLSLDPSRVHAKLLFVNQGQVVSID